MFTGIIEEIGRIRSVKKGPEWIEMEISASKIMEGVRLGDSIAVNGTCLTVTRFDENGFAVDVMPETVAKTALKQLSPGSAVNLERAMAAGDRFGGHFVSGHVDGVGTITSRKPFGNAVVFEVETPQDVLKYILPKGSVAIDGISLTVVDLSDKGFSVSIIPHTLKETILQYKKVNDPVNLEADMMAKYIERFLSARFQGQEQTHGRSGVTEAFLRENGFM